MRSRWVSSSSSALAMRTAEDLLTAGCRPATGREGAGSGRDCLAFLFAFLLLSVLHCMAWHGIFVHDGNEYRKHSPSHTRGALPHPGPNHSKRGGPREREIPVLRRHYGMPCDEHVGSSRSCCRCGLPWQIFARFWAPSRISGPSTLFCYYALLIVCFCWSVVLLVNVAKNGQNSQLLPQFKRPYF